MHADRYLKIILTIIALELLWMGLRDVAPPVAAQVTPTPVIIRGIDMSEPGTGALPVAIAEVQEAVPIEAAGTIRIEAARPLTVQVDRPLLIEAAGPIRVEADPPLKVESVPYTPAPRPGE